MSRKLLKNDDGELLLMMGVLLAVVIALAITAGGAL